MVIDIEDMRKQAKSGDMAGAFASFMEAFADAMRDPEEDPAPVATPADPAHEGGEFSDDDIDKVMDSANTMDRVLVALCGQSVTVCGHVINVDLTDADVLERYEHARTYLPAELKRLGVKPGVGSGESARSQCRAIETYMDMILGEGTAERVFDGHHASLGMHWQFVSDIARLSVTALKTVNDERNRAMQLTQARARKEQSATEFRQYAASKAGNRAQRRRKH